MITKEALLELFTETRKDTEKICAPLETEDYVVQPVVDVSPPKWHLGHTTWFFEEFVLKKFAEGYQLFDDNSAFVFNSYYESVGEKVVRTDRGNLSRPTVAWVYEYRKYVTEAVVEFFSKRNFNEEIISVLEIGCHHEKQHQELLLTDIKYILGNNPLLPYYSGDFEENEIDRKTQEWIKLDEGIYEAGHTGDDFSYDNELGQHKNYLQSFEISSKLVTNGEYLQFMEAGGYKDVLLWHAEGWDWIHNEKISAPFYWHRKDNEWHQYTLQGLEKIDPEAPLSHISYFEAFAYTQWKGCRLPTEFEWEAASKEFDWGKRWEWTESSYSPYPGFKTAEGALGEYNGKFMVNQKVLRGGSVATAKNHTRHTYRNFFQPHLRWQFTGIRLAK